MPQIDLSFESNEESLTVTRFAVQESMSGLFEVSVEALSPHDDLDLSTIVGRGAGLRVGTSIKHALVGQRTWTGVCCSMELLHSEPTGASTYGLRLVPDLWLLTQRRNHRMFQHLSLPDIVKKIFGEWHLKPTWTIDEAAYAKLEMRVQYGESDFAFVSRLLEEAGIAYWFVDDKGRSVLTLGDAPQRSEARPGDPLDWFDNPNQMFEREVVTRVRLAHEIRPGKVSLRDFDFRLKPDYLLLGASPAAPAPEDAYEQYHYVPGAFRFEGGKGGDTPVADDQGVARTDEKAGAARATRALEAQRATRQRVAFETNAIDLAPGVIFRIGKHARADLAPDKKLLVIERAFEGTPAGQWIMKGRAVFADKPYRPPLSTPKPQIHGVQSALVVGPAGQEIYTDEFGRVRVHFPWDREGKYDDKSSCWLRVSQGWAGGGYGIIAIPRVGQEVLVGFFEGDPDQPVVIGRVFNNTTRVPYKLPDHKTVTTWKSSSSPDAAGFNEIKFEDAAGKEMVYHQAEKDLTKLVKHDEAETTGHDLTLIVKHDRVSLVEHDDTETVAQNRVTVVKKNLEKHVLADELELTDKDHRRTVGGDQALVVKKNQLTHVGADLHLHVEGDDLAKVDGSLSLTVGGGVDQKVGKSAAFEAAKEIHIQAGTKLIIEAGTRLTLKGPGGFVDIDGGGVTIKGSMVKINSGGSAGSGKAAKPKEPKDAEEVEIKDPDPPEDFSAKK